MTAFFLYISSDIGRVMREDFYLVLNDQKVFRVFQAKQEAAPYRFLTRYSQEVGASFIDRQILMSYIRRVDNVIRNKTGAALFAKEDTRLERVGRAELLESLISAMVTETTTGTRESELELKETYKDIEGKIMRIEKDMSPIQLKVPRS